MSSVLRVSILVGMVIAVVSIALDISAAEPAVCDRLRQQLTSSSSEARSSSGTYSRAAQQQAINLQQTRIKARQAGCGGTVFSRGDPAQCASFERTIDQLSAKVEKMQRGGSQPAQSRQRITASLKANGCVVQRPKRFLEVLFGRSDPEEPILRPKKSRSVRLEPNEPKNQQKRRSVDSPETLATTYEGVDPKTNIPVKKGYRTVCVRTCDGYYFPISFSTKRKYFTRDQNACSAMCPAGDAKLYFHAVPEQESADMVSVTGSKPYANLPNAFNYRTAGVRAVSGCACHAAQQVDMSTAVGAIGQSTDMVPERATAISLPAYPLLGNSQEPRSKDETAADTEIGPTKVDPATVMNAKDEPLSSKAVQLKIRVVGPTFFPKTSEAIDLRSPPHDSPPKETVPTRFTAKTVVETIASNIWHRIY